MKCESYFNSFTILFHLPTKMCMFVYPSILIDFFLNRELATSSSLSRVPTKDYLINSNPGTGIYMRQFFDKLHW